MDRGPGKKNKKVLHLWKHKSIRMKKYVCSVCGVGKDEFSPVD